MKTFIIFGMGRTGSSLLQTLLNSHGQICCEGELFRIRGWPPYLHPIVRVLQRYPLPYVAYRRFRAQLFQSKTVYGFKLHSKLHAEQVVDAATFLHTAHRKGWKIIHLQRASLFNQVISGLVGRMTKRYFGHGCGPEPTMQLSIPVDLFRTNLEQTYAVDQNHQQILADIPHLTFVYEQALANEADWQNTVVRICGYLDVPAPLHVETYCTKPWSRPYIELISNYAELRALANESHVCVD